MKMRLLSIGILGFVLAAPACAAEPNLMSHTEASHMDHQHMQEQVIPQSPGQDAFGAVQGDHHPTHHFAMAMGELNHQH